MDYQINQYKMLVTPSVMDDGMLNIAVQFGDKRNCAEVAALLVRGEIANFNLRCGQRSAVLPREAVDSYYVDNRKCNVTLYVTPFYAPYLMLQLADANNYTATSVFEGQYDTKVVGHETKVV